MNQRIALPFFKKNAVQQLEISELESVLELLPTAALLVENDRLQILRANSRAAALTAFTRSELQAMRTPDLFTDWQQLVETSAGNLVNRNGDVVEVSARRQSLGAKDAWMIVMLESSAQRAQQEAEARRQTLMLMGTEVYSQALFQEDLLSAVKTVLSAGLEVSKALALGVYLIGEESNRLVRLTALGDSQALPADLPGTDLARLEQPSYWMAGRRPIAEIQQLAYEKNWAFVATAPLSNQGAVFGLLVAAGDQPNPSELVQLGMQVMATTLTGLVFSFRRLGYQKSQNQTQRRRQAVLQTIENSVQEGILVISPQLTIRRMNLAAEMALGYAGKEVQGQSVENILIGSESLAPALTAAQQGSPTYNLGNVRLYRRYGDAFLAHMSIFPAFFEGGLEAILVIFRDLSEQEQIREHTQQLEQRAFLGELTAVFAHEVRNPINNISTGLQLVSMKLPEDDPNREVLERLEQDTDRLAELMKGVLSASRSSTYDTEPIKIEQLIRHLIDRLHPRLARVNVRHTLKADPDCPPISGNRRSLEQVFNNLINNAAQAMDKNGGTLAFRITKETSPQGKSLVMISVADTGPGIPPEVQERIFQPFFTTKREGTGLGLAIVKQIINAHQGTIRLESFPTGTVFHIQLPALEE